MTDIHALSGAYAVDALDNLERARFERHLAECADCRAEVASLREAAALLTEAYAVPPPPHVREQVLAGISTVRPLPPARPSARPVHRWATRLVAAAAIAVLAGAGTIAVHPWSTNHTPVADQVISASDAVRHEAALPGGGTATVVSSTRLKRAVMVARDLPEPPAGKTYELWLLTPDGTMHPAGLMTSGGSRTVVLKGDASRATGAGLTVEPAGGSTEPTADPLAVFSFRSA